MFDATTAIAKLDQSIATTYPEIDIIKGSICKYLEEADQHKNINPLKWHDYIDAAYGQSYEEEITAYLLIYWPKLKSKDIKQYMHQKKVEETYGYYPKTVSNYVDVYTQISDIVANFATVYHGDKSMSMADLERDAYEQIVNLRMNEYKIMPYTDRLLSNCIGKWYEMQQQQCRESLLQSLTAPHNYDTSASYNEWVKLSEIIDKNPASREKTINILQHWMYNLKRSLAGHVASDPIMPVLTGVQNNGKSTAVKKLLTKINDANGMWVTDIKQLTDPNSYMQCYIVPVAFLDEMDKFDKTSAATTKAFLTKDNVSARKLFTQFFDTKQKLIQTIGTANGALDTIITDTTGTRRYWEIQTPDEMSLDRDWWDRIDFDLLWYSVDVDAADPMTRDEYLNIYTYQQDNQRRKSFVEEWIESDNISGCKNTSEWFVEWQDWANTYQQQMAKTSLTTFGRFLKNVPGASSNHTKNGTQIDIPSKSNMFVDDLLTDKIKKLRINGEK
jgi:hypothetical protein